MKMAVTVVSFRWLEILEKEFDKNFVDLDLLIGDLDGEEPDLVYSARQKLAGLSSCFAQLTHKAQTIFENSAKTEAELVDLRAELVQTRTRQEVLEEDCRNLVLQLHSLQLERLPSNQNPEQYKEKIDNALKHSPSKGSYSDESHNGEVKRLRQEITQFAAENAALRTSVLALTSEVYGARLAAKYLDKELAGRIQQLQLLGKEMRSEVRDKLWRQLESEILLHRHKTVIRACRNRPHLDLLGGARPSMLPSGLTVVHNSQEPTGMVGEKRVVVVKRKQGQGLGISITGGLEHGVPILISELEDGGPAHECGNLFVGDAILRVDDVSLENASHFEAVNALTNLKGDEVRLVVQFIAADTDEETSIGEDLFGYRYRFFDTEVMDSTDVLGLHPVHTDHDQEFTRTPTAPRTPDAVRDETSCIWKPSPSPKDEPRNIDIDLFGHRFRTDVESSSNHEDDIKEENNEEDKIKSSMVKELNALTQSFKQQTVEKRPMTILNALDDEKAKMDAIRKSARAAKQENNKLTTLLDAEIFAGLEDTSTLDNIVKSFSEDDFSCVEAPMTSDSGLYSSDELRIRPAVVTDSPEKSEAIENIQLRTLQQIFDRSFSSNLSSPHESTSFDDDIFSTEHSDDKNGNYLDDFRSKLDAYGTRKMHKYYKVEDVKKSKRGETQKRGKNLRKKEAKTDKRRRDDSDGFFKKGLKATERFEEGLLEYVKEPDVDDAVAATRKLSLQYGLRLPDARPRSSSPSRVIKVIEGHFKTPAPERQEKPKTFRSMRYDSFGDPDFGTPV